MSPTKIIGVVTLTLLQVSFILAGNKISLSAIKVLSQGYPCQMLVAPRRAGVVFRLKKFGTVVMLDKNIAAYVVKGGFRTLSTTVATIDVSKGPAQLLETRHLMLSNTIPRDGTVALLRTLVNKKLPYSYCGCNEVHYMNYFLGGDPHTGSGVPTDCLMGRTLHGVTKEEIESKSFELQNKNGERYLVATLSDY